MKKITILTLSILTLGFTSCKKNNAIDKINTENLVTAKNRDVEIKNGAAIVSFDKSSFDFGTVTEGEIVETVFKVTNSGKTDFVIEFGQDPSDGK